MKVWNDIIISASLFILFFDSSFKFLLGAAKLEIIQSFIFVGEIKALWGAPVHEFYTPSVEILLWRMRGEFGTRMLFEL